MTEFRLFDEPGSEVAKIVTDGATVKPFLNAISVVADEAKIHVTEDGLHSKVVDPANVFMGEFGLAADAFDTFDLSESAVLGVDVDGLQSAVRRARKRSDDELTLSIRERELTATVARGYENHDVVSQSRMDLMDPDHLREEPDLPDLDLPVNISVDYRPFIDALDHALGFGEYARIETIAVNQHATALYMGSETDVRQEQTAISNVDTEESVEALYSGDYLTDMLNGLSQIEAEQIHLRMGDEFPMFATAEAEGIEIEYATAPRIQSE